MVFGMAAVHVDMGNTESWISPHWEDPWPSLGTAKQEDDSLHG